MTTKSDILVAIRRERALLDAVIARVGEARMTEPTLDAGWSVKDVLAHISAWEKICMALVRNNTPVDPPPPGETGPSTDLINQRVYEGSRDRSLEDVVADAQRSYTEMLAMIEGLSNDAVVAALGGAEGSPHVGQLISENSDNHYREHIVQIERWLSKA